MSSNILYEHRRNDIYSWNESTNHNGRLEYRTPHLHREMELVFYMGGRTVVYVDSARFELEPGDIFLTFPNQIHSYETLAPETFHLFLIKPELMPELADVFDMALPTSPVIPHMAEHPRIRSLWTALAEICDQKENTPYRKTLLHGYLLALFSELLGRMELIGMSQSDSDALRSIVSFCSRNYDKELSLSMLEKKLHLNKYYISHLFSGKLGLRFNDYINSLRVSEACRRLLNTGDSITEISDRVGFNTLRTFNRAFVKQIGISPSEYRKNGGTPPISSAEDLRQSTPAISAVASTAEVKPPPAYLYMDDIDGCGCC